jgi:hypothetical protein
VPSADLDQRRAAVAYIQEAWAEALLDGIEADCMAQACLFSAFAELVSTYGEEAAATYAVTLANRIRNHEFSFPGARQ